MNTDILHLQDRTYSVMGKEDMNNGQTVTILQMACPGYDNKQQGL